MTQENEAKTGRRLSERPAPEIQQYIYGVDIQEEMRRSFTHLTVVNRAHVVMLFRQGIISRDAARTLLDALDDIESKGTDGLELDPEREGLYYNYEHAVITRTSPAIGGQMHTARSRNDLGATLQRMLYRDVVLEMLDALHSLRSELLLKAEEHHDTVMPGYTHLQPAQPITLGHYLTAIESALSRDTERIYSVLGRINYCPLGAGALAGTGFPIDRDIVARLLGFEAPLPNTLDCVASRDYLQELLGAASILGVTLSRFAQDLFVWYTDEFGLISFRDRVAGTSSIMPQKKNPILQEYIKGRTAQPLGAFASAIAGVRNTNFTNVIDANREAFGLGSEALDNLLSAVHLSRLAVENMVVRKHVMLERCKGNFTTVTQLADTLVQDWGISFRQAHEIVGSVVRTAMERGLRAGDITAQMVLQAAQEEIGFTKPLSDDTVHKALDPVHNVLVRSHTGGPAPAEVRRMVTEFGKRLSEHKQLHKAFRAQLSKADAELNKAASEV